jgi:hypothetical protein
MSLLGALVLIYGVSAAYGQTGTNGNVQGSCVGFGSPLVQYGYNSPPANLSDPNGAAFVHNSFLRASVPQASPETSQGPAPSPSPTTEAAPASCDEPLPSNDPSYKPRFWLTANYAAIFIKPMNIAVPLATTGSLADASPAAIGQPNTTILTGNTFQFGMLSGIQTDAGVFLDSEGCWALQWSGLFVVPAHARSQFSSDATGNPLIARPIFNTNTGINQVLVDSIPGSVAGAINIDARTAFFDTEANLTYRCKSVEKSHADLLCGFRYMHLAEDLRILDQLTPLVPGVLTFETGPANPPNSLVDFDRFSTANNFFGLQLGGLCALEQGRWFCAGWGKAGLGVTNQMAFVNGSTALVTPTGRQFAGGGVLAVPTNMGQYSRNVLGFVPEGGLTLGVNVTAHVQLTLGYSFLYWNNVIRPGTLLNSTINPTQIPTTSGFGTATGPASPQFQFVSDTFWMHNVTCGVAVHF